MRSYLSNVAWAPRPCLLLLCLIMLSCSGPAGTAKYEKDSFNPKGGHSSSTPATQPSSSAGENYGKEESRLVYEKDEIVSVLKNGMIVIAKRVPSPAVTVRGYVMAGGVYEGRW